MASQHLGRGRCRPTRRRAALPPPVTDCLPESLEVTQRHDHRSHQEEEQDERDPQEVDQASGGRTLTASPPDQAEGADDPGRGEGPEWLRRHADTAAGPPGEPSDRESGGQTEDEVVGERSMGPAGCGHPTLTIPENRRFPNFTPRFSRRRCPSWWRSTRSHGWSSSAPRPTRPRNRQVAVAPGPTNAGEASLRRLPPHDEISRRYIITLTSSVRSVSPVTITLYRTQASTAPRCHQTRRRRSPGRESVPGSPRIR